MLEGSHVLISAILRMRISEWPHPRCSKLTLTRNFHRMLSISSLFGSLYGYGIVAILLTVAIVISTYLLQTKIQSLKCFVERQMSPLGAVRRNEVPQEPPRVRGNGVEDLVDLGRREELTAPGPVPPRDRLQL